MRYLCDLLGLGLVVDGALKTGGFRQKRLPFWLGRKRGELRGDGRRELFLLGIFGRARDGALRHGTGVIHRDVVEQPPRGFDVTRLCPRYAEETQSEQHGKRCQTWRYE